MLKPNNFLNPSNPHQPKNMVTRIYRSISTSDDEQFQEPCFSISHVVVMSHLDMLGR
jgi:hypothetical protein